MTCNLYNNFSWNFSNEVVITIIRIMNNTFQCVFNNNTTKGCGCGSCLHVCTWRWKLHHANIKTRYTRKSTMMIIHVKVDMGWCTCKWWQCNNFSLGECDKPRQLFKKYLSLWNSFHQLVRLTNFVCHN